MVGNTRKGVVGHQKLGRVDTTPNRPSAPPTPSVATAQVTPGASASCPEHDDGNIESLYNSLSQENKTLIKIIKSIISEEFQNEVKALKEDMARKETEMEHLRKEVKTLTNKVTTLETQIDDVEQYERRDTIIMSGPSVPVENKDENTLSVAVATIKDHLKINVKENEVSVAHRLGLKQNQTRPIIIKLVNRSLKYDLVGACIKMK